MAISARKIMVVAVNKINAEVCRCLLEREEGLRPAKGSRFRLASVANNSQYSDERRVSSEAVLLRPNAKKFGKVREA